MVTIENMYFINVSMRTTIGNVIKLQRIQMF